MASRNLLLPIKLDAFVLNAAVCDGTGTESKIAPITQPNYSYLRIKQGAARADVLPHVDLHLASPSTRNPRITNLSTRKPRPGRQGVYLHWTLPRLYRTGVSTAADEDKSKKEGNDKKQGNDADPSAPVFPQAPNRWLVVRHLVKGTVKPSGADIPETEAWLIESDRLRRIDELDDTVDLQTDVSPFMDTEIRSLKTDGTPEQQSGAHLGGVSIEDQAEIFIGLKSSAKTWKETATGAGSSRDRVKLHILGSSNPLFADYQPHNGGVFSTADTFAYNQKTDGNGKVVSRDHLISATANYYVIGWQSDVAEDVLHKAAGAERRQRLASLSLLLSEGLSGSNSWLDDSGGARIVCHGALYDVRWDVRVKPPTPADEWSNNLNQKQQVAVGTSPIDSILAYVSAHHGEKPSDPKRAETKLIRQLEEDIFNLTAHLRAQEDTSVESYRRATDMLVHNNHVRTAGGRRYAFAVKAQDGKPTKPTDNDRKALQELNGAQDLLDSTNRSIRAWQWQLFALWFKANSTSAASGKPTSSQVQEVHDYLVSLKQQAKSLSDRVVLCKDAIPGVMEAVHPEYYTQGDPTVMVGGVKSGWAHDFLEKTKVRLDTQLFTPTATGDDNKMTVDLGQINLEAMPDIRNTIEKLLAEFCALSRNEDFCTPDNNLPLYHDAGIELDKTAEGKPLWRDRWNNRQPWFPLFMEWEAEYVHVPWKEWSLMRDISRSSGLPHTHYGIDQDVDLASLTDRRLLSGRILILPQPSFSLSAVIKQVMSTVPEKELDDLLGKGEIKTLRDNVLRLPFLSAPLSGLTDHLLTLAQGSHVKPSVRVPGKEIQAIAEAVDEGLGFTEERINDMGVELDLTPYGNQIHVKTSREDPSPFKPVTHGQLRFTKLNVIDKFGQAIHALQPTASSSAGIVTDGVVPCASEFYQVQAKKSVEGAGSATRTEGDAKEPNVAAANDTNGLSEFIQLPPGINQPARLNAHFVKRESDSITSGWRPADEWEDPTWGWIVVNYVDYGIQLFTSEGIFYREVRLPGDAAHGRTGGVASTAWLPFEETGGVRPESLGQLDQLIEQLTAKDGEYLQSFLDMINGALVFSGATPGAYAEALNCIVGRPLALVNVGFSLELATAPYTNQSTMNGRQPEMKLLSDQEKDQYRFPIKIGDSHREYDALVGYFPVKSRTGRQATDLPVNNELDLTRIYTYFGHDDKNKDKNTLSSSPLQELSNASFPKLSPYWLDPQSYTGGEEKLDAETDSQKHTRDRNSRLQVFGVLMDPFQPLHAYSSFLPAKELRLPEWTWQQALNHMTAFFHMGPLMVTKDVPNFDNEYLLRADYSLSGEQKVYSDHKVELPANIADWNWLQPYMEVAGRKQQEAGATAPDTGIEYKTKFMPIELGRSDGRPRFEPGPYTAIEGYLQMKQGITKTDMDEES
ncbi:hypothetical protein F5Y17DRAFT_385037 [Xylariaceae sp. FL0594]|nr:hypothetical protein F5Y17DRAFT_385037 [Xylariaceae sp. FL0594]